MVYDTANRLAKELSESEEYQSFLKLKEAVSEDETTKTLLNQYHKLQIRAQAAVVSGEKNDALMQELQKLGELLQMNTDASNYLIAEYRVNKLLSDIYKILADAIGVDLSALES